MNSGFKYILVAPASRGFNSASRRIVTAGRPAFFIGMEQVNTLCRSVPGVTPDTTRRRRVLQTALENFYKA
jgi:hypothetical protein